MSNWTPDMDALPEVTIETPYANNELYAVVRNERLIVSQWEVQRENIAHARECGLAIFAIANKLEEYYASKQYELKELQEQLASVNARIAHLKDELKAEGK